MPEKIQSAKILIVDDDIPMQKLLTRYLSEQGYDAEAVGDGKEMDAWLETQQANLIILDLMLPGEDGLSLARRIRNQRSTPIIMLSARDDEMDKVIGLEVGADDYLAKPFNPRELLARIRAVMRRGCDLKHAKDGENQLVNYGSRVMSTSNLIKFGDYRLDSKNKILLCNNQEVDLTRGEMSLLIIFATHPSRVLNRDQLMDMLSGGDSEPFDRSIDVRITRLRKKLNDSGNNPRYIRTVWGEGYRFTPEIN
jgi:two-component system, OmpR family, phosphate regulon response regulator OmpR